MSDNKFNTEQAARYLGVESRTLQNWRGEGKGPVYYKPTAKLVYYFKSDLDAWIKSSGDSN